MAEEIQIESALADMSVRQFGQVLLVGALSGAVTMGLGWLFEAFIFKALICHGAICAAGSQYAAVFGAIIAAAITLFVLVKLQIFRPLLIVIGVATSLWGLAIQLGNYPWYVTMLITAGLYMTGYGVFAWLARIKQFWLVLIIFILLIVGIRLMLY